jgi:fatty acid amide hydrolase 2
MEIQQRPLRFLKKALHYYFLLIRITLDFVSDLLFGLYYSTFHPRVRLPPLQSSILLESATFLAKKIRSRQLRSIDVLEQFITRIKDINPIINAVVADRFEAARKEARQVDFILDSQEPLSEEYSEENKPFFGVPFTNKEAIRVAGQPNTSGLYLRNGFLAKEDADVVKRMRAAGEC